MSTVLRVFSSTIIDFHPVYLHFIHRSDNEYFMNSEQAFNVFELGDGGQRLFLHRVWNNTAFPYGRWQTGLHFRGTASILSALVFPTQKQFSVSSSLEGWVPDPATCQHNCWVLVKCSVLHCFLTVKGLSVINLSYIKMFCGYQFLLS